MHDDGEALCPADGNVEAITIEQKVCPARRVFAPRRCHGNDDDRCLLSLKFVNRADLVPCGSRCFKRLSCMLCSRLELAPS
jgi:hypothetical protein